MFAGCTATAALSAWQWSRAQQKLAMQAVLLEATAARAEPLDPDDPPGAGELRAVQARGRWIMHPQILVERRVEQGRRRVAILTGLQLDDGRVLMVHRGHVDEARLPEALELPDGQTVRLHGLWRRLPRPGIALGNADCAPRGRAVVPMNHPDERDLACALGGRELLPGVLMLAADAPAALEVRWEVAGLPAERHLGYAFQWAALCAAILLVFLTVNLRKHAR